ncbi:MAG: YbhB/YbcL family Raf kinase inhibitor-like protein [Hyphomicrobiales bacterium]|nr:YbhB/YbcL family Raf kinase inhibitor-like protein [Hyphomicrobiales bacterium]
MAAKKAETPEQLAGELIKASDSSPLEVTSSDFTADQGIPFEHSAFGENVSPQLAWSNAPKGTKSFAIMMEDPDATQPKPFVHWLAYNIPADMTSLRAGLSTPPRLVEPKDMLQGANSTGGTGYFGPKPPDEITHHYHFQVFALDTKLDLPPAADREAVLEAMKDHVLAVGNLVGVFVKPAS